MVYHDNAVTRSTPSPRDIHFPCSLIFTVPELSFVKLVSLNDLACLRIPTMSTAAVVTVAMREPMVVEEPQLVIIGLRWWRNAKMKLAVLGRRTGQIAFSSFGFC